ncbi:MAG: hypothetical protein ABIA63_08505, partial [bacterium]
WQDMLYNSVIRIFTLDGKHIKTIYAKSNQIEWNGYNENNQPAASGIYIFEVSMPEGKNSLGKIMVLR